MPFHAHYSLNRHRKFEQGGRKYVADIEINDIIQVNDVEWEILARYGVQNQYQIVEGLKEKYKITSIFDGIERLERLGQQGSLLSPIDEATEQTVDSWKQENREAEVVGAISFYERKNIAGLRNKSKSLPTLDTLVEGCSVRDAHLFRGRKGRPKTRGLPRFGGDPDSEHRGGGE